MKSAKFPTPSDEKNPSKLYVIAHSLALNTVNNLAGVYESQGRYAEAEMLYKRVLRSQEQQLGSDHPSVLTTMHNLASVYESQGRYAEAKKLYNRVLPSLEEQLGSDHVDVLATKRRLASVSTHAD